MSLLGSLQLGLLGGIALVAAVAVVLRIAGPWLRPRIALLPPSARAWALRALAAAPLLGGLGLLAVCYAPSALAGLWPHLDHCADHGSGHPHLCLVHHADSAGDPVGWLLLVAALAVVVLAGGRLVVRLGRARRGLSALERSAQIHGPTGARVIEVDAPVALAVGVLRPRTIVSRGLLAALSPAQVDAVLLHEQAHARRRDGLWQPLARAFALLHLPATRRWLLRDLELAAEQACDDEAGRALGDRLVVAQALLCLERLLADAPLRTSHALRFGGGAVGARVEALLGPSPATFRPGARAMLAGLGGLLVLVALADPLHHLTEMVAGLVAR